MNQQTIAGQWKQIRGKIKDEWGELTDDELDHVEGNVEQLIGLIQQKTGEAGEAIECKIEQFCKNCDGNPQSVSQAASDYADAASRTAASYAEGVAAAVQHSSDDVTEAMKMGVHQTEEFVKQRPVESLMATFGAGLIAGVVVGLLVRK